MAKLNINLRVSVDAKKAVRDPLIWLDFIIANLTRGRVETGRWKKYLTVQEVESSNG